jgi:hypothetical protein
MGVKYTIFGTNHPSQPLAWTWGPEPPLMVAEKEAASLAHMYHRPAQKTLINTMLTILCRNYPMQIVLVLHAYMQYREKENKVVLVNPNLGGVNDVEKLGHFRSIKISNILVS